MSLVSKFLLSLILFAALPIGLAQAYEEVPLSQVMGELETQSPTLFKKAKKVYKYASINTNEIIDKPLLVKHNKALNAFIDRQTKMSAKFYASDTEGTAARLVMLFKFNGNKYRVVEDYTRAEKCKKFSVCAPWKKVE